MQKKIPRNFFFYLLLVTRSSYFKTVQKYQNKVVLCKKRKRIIYKYRDVYYIGKINIQIVCPNRNQYRLDDASWMQFFKKVNL